MLAVDFFFRSLRKIGVDYVFGVPGHAIMPIYNDLHGRNDVKPILTAHEGGASYMAMHYGQQSQTLGVCIATTGPGSTNLLTGVATAYAEGLPLLAVTGQCHQNTAGMRAYQESIGFGRTVDTVALYKPITKESGLMHSGVHLARTLASWIPLARSGRPGPVHISVPINIWTDDVPDDEAERLLALAALPPQSPTPSAAAVDAVVRAIAEARQPLLVLGRGVANSGAGDLAMAFVRRFGLPVVTTTRGRGSIANDEPFNLGQIGMTSNPHTLRWLGGAGVDLAIAVGTSLSAPSLGPALPLLRQVRRVIAVNLDETECRSVLLPETVVHSGAAEFFDAALARPAPRRPAGRVIPDLPNRHDVTDVVEARPGRLHPLQVIRAINDLTPPDSLFVPDAGSHWVWAMRYLFSRTPNGVLTGRALGGMGQGIAGAIGAALAEPGRKVVSITGDGCFLMHGLELTAAARHTPNAVFVVFNDMSLNRVYHAQQTDFAGKVISSTYPDYRFGDIGAALGVKAVRVSGEDAFAQAYRSAMQGDCCTLIECMIDQDAGLPRQ